MNLNEFKNKNFYTFYKKTLYYKFKTYNKQITFFLFSLAIKNIIHTQKNCNNNKLFHKKIQQQTLQKNYITEQMDKENGNSSIIDLNFISKLNTQNLLLISQFFDNETIQYFLEFLQQNSKKLNDSRLENILFNRKFINKYINFTDRSACIGFYSQSKFCQIQQSYIKKLLINNSKNYKKINKRIQQCKNGLSNTINKLLQEQSTQQLTQYIIRNLYDPILPTLKLKKTNYGMYCNSSFQFYLIQKFLSLLSNVELEFIVEEFKDQLSGKKLQQQESINQCNQDNKNNYMKSQRQIIVSFIKNWEEVYSDNYSLYLISCSKESILSVIHNLIVFLIGLVDSFVESIDIYLDSLSQDMFHQFFQFNVRFSLYRNSCVQLLVQFNSIFKIYQQMLQKLLSNQQKQLFQQFSLYNCFIAKWYKRMNKRHNQFNYIYACLLKKINFKQFIQNLSSTTLNKQQCRIYLQNHIHSWQEQIVGLSNVYLQSPIHEYMQEYDNIIQILKEYGEYMVDISVNQNNILWCGHSNHELFAPYQNYEQTLRQSFKQYFQKIFTICNKIDPQKHLVEDVINKILFELDKQFIKPVILKKIINDISTKLNINVDKGINLNQLQNESQQNTDTFCSDICLQNQKTILQQMSQKDKRLQYYNSLKGIVFVMNQNPRLYRDGQNINNLLKKSAQTKCSNKSYLQQQQERMNQFIENSFHKTVSLEEN